MSALTRALAIVVVACVGVGAAPPRVAAPPRGGSIRLTASIVGVRHADGADEIRIRVTHWSSAAERQQLIATLVDHGQDALVKKLLTLSTKGFISIPGRSWRVRFASRSTLPGGTVRILVATDRYLTLTETANPPPKTDSSLTFLELHVNPDETGEGKLATAEKLRFDKQRNLIEFDTYAAEPVALANIIAEKVR